MNVNDLGSSSYLKKDDVMPDKLVTINGCGMENMAMDGQPREMKMVIHFDEFEKGLACNVTNARVIAAILGADDTDDWIGRKVVLYNDKTITFQGKVTGGIRVREPKNQPKPAPSEPAPSTASYNEPDPNDIPF